MPNDSMQRTAPRAAADAERQVASRMHRHYTSIVLATLAVLEIVGCTSASAPTRSHWVTRQALSNGDSVDLVTVQPTPGAAIARGEQVTFTVKANYVLASAPSGYLVIVLQDESNVRLVPGQTQVRHVVTKGTGTVTLTDTVAVTRPAKLVQMFVLLVPEGVKSTGPAYVLRWPTTKAEKL